MMSSGMFSLSSNPSMVTIQENVTPHFVVFLVCLQCRQVTILEPGTITNGFLHRIHPGKISIATLVISMQHISCCIFCTISSVCILYFAITPSCTCGMILSVLMADIFDL